MDNEGENLGLEQRLRSADWKLTDLQVEYTSRATPQRNSPVEVGYATIMKRTRSIMTAANIPESHQICLAQKDIEHATFLNSLLPINLNNVLQSRHWHF